MVDHASGSRALLRTNQNRVDATYSGRTSMTQKRSIALFRAVGMQTNECAYLAGLIDGEAYVGVTRAMTSKSAKGCKRGIAYRLLLSISMTDSRPLEFAQRITRIGVVKKRAPPLNPNHKQAFVWQAWSRECAQILTRVRQFLVVKAEVADLCIEFQQLMRQPGRFGLSDEEWDRREEIAHHIRLLNRGDNRGKGPKRRSWTNSKFRDG